MSNFTPAKIQDFIVFLDKTLIPDMRETDRLYDETEASGMTRTLEKALRIIKQLAEVSNV
jgi:hypothetical protein